MSIGLSVSSDDGELKHYCNGHSIAIEFLAGFFGFMRPSGISAIADYICDGEGLYAQELGQVAEPTPEDLARVAAMIPNTPAATVLAEAEKAYAEIQTMEESDFNFGKDELLHDFDELLAALREAAGLGYRVRLTIA